MSAPTRIPVKVRLVPRLRVKVTVAAAIPVRVKVRSTDEVLQWQAIEW